MSSRTVPAPGPWRPTTGESGSIYRLIVITDDIRDGTDGLTARALAAARGGATMVQLRLKHTDARSLAEVARALVVALPVPVVVNDRADVAMAVGAAGVHVGADDVPVAALRRILPAGFLIGASVGSDAEAALSAGADYAGIGPVYGSGSKLDAGAAIGLGEFSRLAALSHLPAVAIGGITAETASAAIAAGAIGVAVIAAVFGRPDPESAARGLRSAIDRAWEARQRATDGPLPGPGRATGA
jgi:thiamine-phosphate pyrophosphorylase